MRICTRQPVYMPLLVAYFIASTGGDTRRGSVAFRGVQADHEFAQRSFLLQPWNPEDFPIPYIDRRACRSSQGRFCDPDFILTDADIQDLAAYLQNDTIFVPMGTCQEQPGNGTKVQRALAIVKRMDMTKFHSAAAKELASAAFFARYVHDSWGVGMQSVCGGTGILLFLSEVDRAVYISRGKALEPFISSKRIDTIIRTIGPTLRQKRYGKAMRSAFEMIDNYLQNGPDSIDGNDNSSIWSLVLFMAFAGIVLYSRNRQEQRCRQYIQVETHLNNIDQEYAQALQGRYQTKSCPICLESFKSQSPDTITMGTKILGSDGLPLKLLRCGHVFDDTCWSTWISKGQGQYNQCPICRTDVRVGEGSRRQRDEANSSQPRSISRQSPEGRNILRERNFRLERLQRRYPRIIRPELVNNWCSPTFEGSLTRDPSFTTLHPVRNSSNSTSAHSGTIRSSFGGGRSSGGGGGRW